MSTTDPLPVLNHNEGLRRVRGNVRLYRELSVVFLEDLPRLTGLLQSAVTNGSAKDLHYAAHCLKGSASQLGAAAVTQSAWTLERMGHDGDLTDASLHLDVLEQDLLQLTALLQSLSAEPAPGEQTPQRPANL